MRPSAIPREQKRRTISVPFTLAEVEQIDDVRFARRQSTRREAIRFLVGKGLEAVASESATLSTS